MGTSPAAGTVRPETEKSEICNGVVLGNVAVSTPVLALNEVLVAPATLKAFDESPENVKPVDGFNVIVAVYEVFAANVVTLGDHVTEPVNSESEVIDFTGVAPSTGALTPWILR